jgi:hypothetical protein
MAGRGEEVRRCGVVLEKKGIKGKFVDTKSTQILPPI